VSEPIPFDLLHKHIWGRRPALFVSRFHSICCWCGTEITPGDQACYWPEHDARVAHAGCLRIVTFAEAPEHLQEAVG
jgi:hypothetical protein